MARPRRFVLGLHPGRAPVTSPDGLAYPRQDASYPSSKGRSMPSRLALFTFALLLSVRPVTAGTSLDLGAGNKGLSIGNSSEWSGVRINFIDDGVQSIRGLNLTLWKPEENPDGEIEGVSLGVWGSRTDHLAGLHLGLIGAQANRTFRGVGVGLIGVGVGGDHSGWDEDSTADSQAAGLMIGGVGLGVSGDVVGVAAGGIGMGAGRDASGIFVGGLGVGVGHDLRGLAVGGLGMGVGGNATGLCLGGLGSGIGEDFRGVALAGLGTGVGENASGLMIAGIGQGVGENFQGISLAGIGSGTGEDFTGLGVAGIGLGVGGHLRGVALAGVGVGADRTSALTVAAGTTRGQVMQGVTVSVYNKWETSMEGLSIGLINITEELHGVQLGLLNVVHGNPKGRRLLPLINWGG